MTAGIEEINYPRSATPTDLLSANAQSSSTTWPPCLLCTVPSSSSNAHHFGILLSSLVGNGKINCPDATKALSSQHSILVLR